jgi:hypothetical protein
MEELEISKGQK